MAENDDSFGEYERERDDLERELRIARPEDRKVIFERRKKKGLAGSAPDAVATLYLTLVRIGPLLVYDTSAAAPKKQLVAVIHGIRDQGEWMDMVKQVLADPDAGVVVELIDLGEYFDGWKFMRGESSGALNEFARKLRLAIRAHSPDVKTVIAHSFGTWLLIRSADEHADLGIDLAILCGSVVPRRHRFERMAARPKIIVNECGARDVWPIMAEGFAFCRAYGAYGAGGVWGFRVAGVVDRFHDLGHSGYLQEDFVRSFWKPLIARSGDPSWRPEDIEVPPYSSARRTTPWGVSQLARGWSRLLVLFALGAASAGIVWLCPAEWRKWTFLAPSVWLGGSFAFVAVLFNDFRRWTAGKGPSSSVGRLVLVGFLGVATFGIALLLLRFVWPGLPPADSLTAPILGT